MTLLCSCFFFFKQKTAYEMRISDWSSDVCSSDLSISLERPSCHRRMAWPLPCAGPRRLSGLFGPRRSAWRPYRRLPDHLWDRHQGSPARFSTSSAHRSGLLRTALAPEDCCGRLARLDLLSEHPLEYFDQIGRADLLREMGR